MIDTFKPVFATLGEALRRAKEDAVSTEREHYVVPIIMPAGYTVLPDMPMMGRWWTSDGIQHG